MASTTSLSGIRVRVLAMVNDITQAVVNENTEGTVATAGLNTHPGDALPMARNAITARKRDISPNVAVQELVHSLHHVSLERNSMIWSRNPKVSTLNLNRTLFKSSSLETTCKVSRETKMFSLTK